MTPIEELFEGIDIRAVKLEEWYNQLKGQSVRSQHQEEILEILEEKRKMSMGIDLPPLREEVAYRDWDSKPILYWECRIKMWPRKRQVAQDKIEGYTVATIWIGQCKIMSGGKPQVFETMVFAPWNEKKPLERRDMCQQRYETLEEAEKGHKVVCELLRSILRITRVTEAQEGEE